MKTLTALALTLALAFAVGCGNNYELRTVRGAYSIDDFVDNKNSTVLVRVDKGTGTMCAVGTRPAQLEGDVVLAPCSGPLSTSPLFNN